MGIRIEIREATSKDLPEVADLWELLAEHHEKLSPHFSLAWDSKRKWSKYLKKKFSEISTKLIVAEENGRLVGFMLCLLAPNAPVYKERKIGVVSDVYVLEERRMKGVGREMLNFAVKWFKKNRVRTVQLFVAHDNVAARAVWHQLGFEPFMIYKRLDLERLEEKASPLRTRTIIRRRKKTKK